MLLCWFHKVSNKIKYSVIHGAKKPKAIFVSLKHMFGAVTAISKPKTKTEGSNLRSNVRRIVEWAHP